MLLSLQQRDNEKPIQKVSKVVMNDELRCADRKGGGKENSLAESGPVPGYEHLHDTHEARLT